MIKNAYLRSNLFFFVCRMYRNEDDLLITTSYFSCLGKTCVCVYAQLDWFHFKMICKVHSLVRIHFKFFDLPREYGFTIYFLCYFFYKMAAFFVTLKNFTNIRIFTIVSQVVVCINMNIFDLFSLTADTDAFDKSVTYLIVCRCFV